MVRAGPIKVFVDGGAGSGAVALRGQTAKWRTPPAELRELVARASAAGLQVAAHAIGDGAIAAMCDAVEAAGPAALRLRHRVEHCTACPPDLQARMASLGMVAVMQPLFRPYARAATAAAFGERLAPYLAAHASLARAGVQLAFSSDLPVTPEPNPWLGVAAAAGPGPERLSLLAALRAYTLGGAWASFEEGVKGTLEPGRLADLQVYTLDPLSVPQQEWNRLRPALVLVGGRPVSGSLAAF
jgi:predicted amidohydrolase YtcJ